jgi:hypothetical protein
MNIQLSVSGSFKIEVVRNGVITKSLEWFDNLITNNGLNLMGTEGNYLSYCQVGGGSTAPSVSDTALVSRIAGVAATGALASSIVDGYLVVSREFSFATGAAAGNISEIGIGPVTTGNLFSRTLIKDGLGNPTTITILADEILNVSYEFKIKQPTVDFVGNVSGINYKIRAAMSTNSVGGSDSGWRVTNSLGSSRLKFVHGTVNRNPTSLPTIYSGNIGPDSGIPTGSEVAIIQSISNAAYVQNSFKTDFTFTMPPALFNGTFRSGLFYPGPCAFQYEFSPDITKTNLQELVIGFSVSWARE